MSQTILEPISQDPTTGNRWAVVIYNNDTTEMTEVVNILISATGCPVREALDEALEAHLTGRAQVHVAAHQTCREIAAVINLVGVKTSVEPACES